MMMVVIWLMMMVVVWLMMMVIVWLMMMTIIWVMMVNNDLARGIPTPLKKRCSESQLG